MNIMKTIEEKAKAYDEAIEGIQEILSSGEDSIKMSRLQLRLQGIFPGLKKLEDERIKGAIIDYLKDNNLTEWAVWLEKHGEPVREDLDSEALEEEIKRWIGCEAFPEGTDITPLPKAIKIVKNTAYHFAKFQKPADKTEPKFKVGDWVVYVCGEESTTLQISRIIEGTYEFTDGSSLNVVDEDTLHLWTIQDAKDGDVLITNKKQPFIFNGHYDEDTDYIYAYCGISDLIKDDSFYCEKEGIEEEFKVWCTNENVCPANKEQRDLLFQKMKEAGYKWDAEKKELKKIHVIDEGKAEMDYCFTKMMKGEKVTPAWSEEDENWLINAINVCKLNNYNETAEWLKSLKDRVLPQNTWKPSDEELIKAADKYYDEVLIKECDMDENMAHHCRLAYLQGLGKQLNKLKE